MTDCAEKNRIWMSEKTRHKKADEWKPSEWIEIYVAR
jgi:hypothetical protein